MNRSTGTIFREVITSLFTALVRRYLLHCDQFWSHNRRKTWVNEGGFSEGPPGWLGLDHLACRDRLRDQALFSLETRWLWGETEGPLASTSRLSKTWSQALQKCVAGGQEANTGNGKKRGSEKNRGSDWV